MVKTMRIPFALALAAGLALVLSAAVPPPRAEGGLSYTVRVQSGSMLAPGGGRRAPNVAFVDAKGAPQTLSAWRGRTVLVVLWSRACAPCLKQLEDLDRLQGRLGMQGFEVLALAQGRESADSMRRFFQQQGLTNLKVYLDPEARAARALGARGIPTGMLIDPAGRVAGTVEGPAEWGAPDVVEAIRRVMLAR
jgi:peroxiredoxin